MVGPRCFRPYTVSESIISAASPGVVAFTEPPPGMLAVAPRDRETRGAAASLRRRGGLDQKRDNRKRVVGEWVGSPLDGQVSEGSIILRMQRGGGPFDPEGCRAVDVFRSDDIKAVCLALAGRWVLITPTVDRKLFIGPEAAYQRCNEYVRKAASAACPQGIWVACFEVQGKTGAGWPHWHILAYCPDNRPASQIKADFLRAWRTKTEHVDPDTGEVTVSSERIGFVDVQDARSAGGVAVYTAKYLTKAWPAVPEWMGRSRKRFRKVRFASKFYDVLERLYRHERHRGGRDDEEAEEKPKRRLGATRRLWERMARSGVQCAAFRVKEYGRTEFVRTVPIPRDHLYELVRRDSLRAVRLGRYPTMIFEASIGFLQTMDRQSWLWRRRQREYEARRLAEISSAWERMQEGRAYGQA